MKTQIEKVQVLNNPLDIVEEEAFAVVKKALLNKLSREGAGKDMPMSTVLDVNLKNMKGKYPKEFHINAMSKEAYSETWKCYLAEADCLEEFIINLHYFYKFMADIRNEENELSKLSESLGTLTKLLTKGK